jgi:hypothetical protein
MEDRTRRHQEAIIETAGRGGCSCSKTRDILQNFTQEESTGSWGGVAGARRMPSRHPLLTTQVAERPTLDPTRTGRFARRAEV